MTGSDALTGAGALDEGGVGLLELLTQPVLVVYRRGVKVPLVGAPLSPPRELLCLRFVQALHRCHRSASTQHSGLEPLLTGLHRDDGAVVLRIADDANRPAAATS